MRIILFTLLLGLTVGCAPVKTISTKVNRDVVIADTTLTNAIRSKLVEKNRDVEIIKVEFYEHRADQRSSTNNDSLQNDDNIFIEMGISQPIKSIEIARTAERETVHEQQDSSAMQSTITIDKSIVAQKTKENTNNMTRSLTALAVVAVVIAIIILLIKLR